MSESNRRSYPRLLGAPVLWRRSGQSNLDQHQAVDVSAGGIRLYADAPHVPGEHLELDLFLPDRTKIVCIAEVAWVEALPLTAPARFDVGLKFIEISQAARAKLAALLKSA
jgi:hypothetical protein